jgi:hypothetical protein
MAKKTLSIVPYFNSYEDYLKKKEMNQLIDNMNNITINEECALCKKLRQKLGKNNRFAKIMKCIKK